MKNSLNLLVEDTGETIEDLDRGSKTWYDRMWVTENMIVDKIE